MVIRGLLGLMIKNIYKITYRHGETIDKIAQAFGLPSRHELETMYRYPYQCLADVVRKYTSKI